jgi:hypothetical protein
MSKYETPDYEVLIKEGEYEIRRYVDLFGAIQYSGFSNKSKELKMKKKLDIWIQKKGYKRQSNYMLAFYNAPFTPPMFRRNEIWVRIIGV